MKIFICIFFFLILLVLTSKLKINIERLEKEPNSLKVYFRAKLGIVVLGFLKIFEISLNETEMKFLAFKIPYPKLNREKMKNFRKNSIFSNFKSNNLKLEKLNFNMKIGTESIIFTVFSVFVISTALSALIARNPPKAGTTYYEVIPVYNSNYLSFKISAVFSMSIIRFIKILKPNDKEVNDNEVKNSLNFV